jgi:uncharacterized protein YkwD
VPSRSPARKPARAAIVQACGLAYDRGDVKEISSACAGALTLSACLGGPVLGDGDGGGEGGGDGGIPEVAYCDDVVDWDDAFASLEEQVLALVNDVRAQGTACGGVSAPPTHPLAMHGALRCAARVHARDMAARGYFDHVNPEGEDPFVRMERAGYVYVAAGENIAGGQPDAASVMQGWIDSPGHCQNIMSPDFLDLGVGYFAQDGSPFVHYWVQTFGQSP